MADKNLISFLIDRQKGRCGLCGTPFDFASQFKADTPTIDHLFPRSKGGSDENLNLCLAHRECNEAKADMYIWEAYLSNEFLSVINNRRKKLIQVLLNTDKQELLLKINRLQLKVEELEKFKSSYQEVYDILKSMKIK